VTVLLGGGKVSETGGTVAGFSWHLIEQALLRESGLLPDPAQLHAVREADAACARST